jgi:predicted dehydrogenase
MRKVKWGILSTAKIGREKVIPAMQKGEFCDIFAIASRDALKAKEVAAALGIPVAYSSYEELLSDKEVEAIYIPLPNNLHVEWAIKSLQAGKHVLCEKPIGLDAGQAMSLAEAAKKYPALKIMEAFMYRYHSQWQYAKKLVDEGSIGELRTIQSFFSYHNIDPNNIRNKKEAGGGGMMDIGCYCINLSRFIFNAEPKKVCGSVTFDPELKTDNLSSGILEFDNGTSTFTCSTKLFPYQRVNIMGTEGRVEIMIPFNAPPGESMEIWHHTMAGPGRVVFNPADQYTLQGDAFSKCIIDDTPVPYALEDAVNNMKVIDAVFRSAAEEKWVYLR